MNNIRLGQYIERNSIIHNLDPRCKILCSLLLMTIIFLIPNPIGSEYMYLSFAAIILMFLIIFIIILFSKISIIKYIKSIRQIIFIIFFTFCVQVLSVNAEGKEYNIGLNLSYINIAISVILIILFFVIRKKLPMKLFLFVIVLGIDFFLLTLDFPYVFKTVQITAYEYGIYKGIFYSTRILLVIMVSTILTLTTKPTEITLGIERLLKPLTIFKINVSVFAMLISLALRYIPTLFDETNKILKAQSSRGADFSEGSLKDQINQIISLLIPMFVISYKRAEDLAYAMEARGYIPGERRTSINELRFKAFDYINLICSLLLFAAFVVWRIVL